MQTKESIEVKGRFVQALDALIARKVLKGKKTFAERHNITRSNLVTVLNTDNYGLQVGFLTIMVREYKVSAHWLLTGEGDMFSPAAQAQTRLF